MREAASPILVGCARLTVRDGERLPSPPSPQGLMVAAEWRALADSGAAPARLVPHLDTVAAIRTFADSAPQFATPFGRCDNYPAHVARALGARPRRCLYPVVGGNTPQWLVNLLAEEIRTGRSEMALIVAAEAMRTAARASQDGRLLDWQEAGLQPPEVIGDPRPGVSPHELRHGLGDPPATYALFETARAAHLGRPMARHLETVGALWARFSEAAAQDAMAALPVARSAREIVTIGAENRLVAWPYTKLMCANMFVDQSAAVLLTSTHVARALGIDERRWIWLAGSADIDDKWYVSERVDYHSAPAIGIGARAALDQAGVDIADIDAFDLYSCFPVAVALAADALGLALDDPRGLTLTGGLTFYGGPGNGYALHAIAAMMEHLRARPGGRGLISGNGWYLTKHSFGVYQSAPPAEPWVRSDPASLQAMVDGLPSPVVRSDAEGTGRIEAFTVPCARDGTMRAIVIGRLDSDGSRFLANAADADLAFCKRLMAEESIGRPVHLRQVQGRGIVTLP
ncbi:MAG: acetyl-CoA acetyltransferase [Rhodothalassiaceae bacterium]